MGGFLDGIDGDRLYRLLQTGIDYYRRDRHLIDKINYYRQIDRWTEWAHEAGQAAEETRHLLVEMLKILQN